MQGRLLAGLLLLALLGACATPPQSAALLGQAATEFSEPHLIEALPFFPQDDYQCGPAALATMLQQSGITVTPEQLVPLVYVPARKGSFQLEMTAAARSYGRLVYTLAPTLEAMLREVGAGHPVLVLQNLGLGILPRWHFAVVKGYDLQRRQLILNSGRIEDYAVSLATFERTWARADHWAQVVLPPAELPVTAEPQPFFNASVALEETGQLQQASVAFGMGLLKWPDNQSLLMGAGNLQYTLGDSAGALQSFSEVVRLYPDFAPAHNNLAQVLHENGRSGEALLHAQRAVELGGPFVEQYRSTLRLLEENQ